MGEGEGEGNGRTRESGPLAASLCGLSCHRAGPSHTLEAQGGDKNENRLLAQGGAHWVPVLDGMR